MEAPLDRDTFLTVVRSTPLVSIDLLVRDPAGRVLVGLRTNAPARGSWFVPGGRIRKGERLAAAFRRLTRAELGRELDWQRAAPFGTWEHLYDDNALGADGVGTHYVVLAYQIALEPSADPSAGLPLEQHEAYRWLSPDELLRDPSVHANTRAYFESA